MQDQIFEYNEPKKVVVVGAGFGGLSAALELGKLKTGHRKHQDFNITVIDRNDYQLFTPELYEIASAAKDYASEEDLKKVVCVNARMALGQQSVEFIHATVEKIDTHKKAIHTSKGEMPYDYLILAPGSEPFYFGIPGMKENSIPLKWLNDAVHIRNTVMETLDSKKEMHVVICGAGPAGVEVAAELAHMCNERPNYGNLTVHIVDRNTRVLSSLNERAQKIAMKRLTKLGIQLHMGFSIAQAQKGKVISDQGEEIKGDLIMWTGGIKAHAMLESTGLKLTERGQIAVKNTLQTHEDDSIFVIGDSAEVKYKEEYSPQTAHEAVHQGPLAARNIFEHMNDGQLTEYKIKDEGFVVTMGGKHGLVILPNGLVIRGFFGWFLRRFVDFRHFRSVLPFMQACSMWYNALKVMNKND